MLLWSDVTQIAEHLRAHVFEMIREKIEEYVADKVRDQVSCPVLPHCT